MISLPCSNCPGSYDRVLDTRHRHGYIHRRRECKRCGSRLTTREVPAGDSVQPRLKDIEGYRVAVHRLTLLLLRVVAIEGRIAGPDASPEGDDR